MSDALSPDILNNPLLSNWLRFSSDSHVELYAGKFELGQGIGVVLIQIAADELDISLESISLINGNTDFCPDQGYTAGSLSTQVGAMALRQICAEVRTLFILQAASDLSVTPDQIRLKEGVFSVANLPQTLTYSDLIHRVNLNVRASGLAKSKTPETRLLAGASTPRPDLNHKLFGAGFIQDLALPDMLHGRILRPPSYEATLQSFDLAAQRTIRSMPGVHALFVSGRYIGVCAEREEQTIAALQAIQKIVCWHEEPLLPPEDHAQRWLNRLENNVSILDRVVAATAVKKSNTKSLEVRYSKPFIAHASIGPSCALAKWDDDHLTVWTHSQGIFPLRRELGKIFDIPLESITVVHADGAGCYGHNGADDAAFDAAMLAKEAGRPVRLQWMRDDEFAWSPFGSAMSIAIDAEVDETGKILDWHQETWSHTHVQRPGLRPGHFSLAALHRHPPAPVPACQDFPLAMGGGGERNACPIYKLPNRNIEYHLITSPTLRTSALRALGAFANVFAIESCMDELAQIAGQDPLSFRLAHLEDHRAIEVLNRVARKSGWTNPLDKTSHEGAVSGRGLGFARYKGTGAYCAVVVDIEVTDRIELKRFWTVVDAGEIIHPDGMINQLEGGIIQAASWTLKEAVHFDTFRVTSRGWQEYPVLGFSELPEHIDVSWVSSPHSPALGVGECAAGPTAAAIANALSNALGIRIRDLPLTPERLMQAIQSA